MHIRLKVYSHQKSFIIFVCHIPCFLLLSDVSLPISKCTSANPSPSAHHKYSSKSFIHNSGVSYKRESLKTTSQSWVDIPCGIMKFTQG